MTDLYPIHYDAVHRQIGALAVSPAELHGALCGYLCGGGQPVSGRWLAQLCIDDEGLTTSAHDDLETLRKASITLLQDPDLRFQPFLPDDTATMDVRVTALAEWCTGFLGGFGLTGVGKREGLSEEATDALRDIDRIAHFGYEAGDEEEDEGALAEILEYVRVAALLLYQDAAQTAAPADVTRH